MKIRIYSGITRIYIENENILVSWYDFPYHIQSMEDDRFLPIYFRKKDRRYKGHFLRLYKFNDYLVFK